MNGSLPVMVSFTRGESNTSGSNSVMYQLDGTPGGVGLYRSVRGSGGGDSTIIRTGYGLEYSMNKTTSNNAFGPGSSYGSMYMTNILSLVGVNTDISSFYYSGETGSDSSRFARKTLTPAIGSGQNTFGLPADVVALITSRFGTVANYLRLRNQGQI